MSDRPGIVDRIDISVGLVRASASILLKNRGLLIFPFISTIAALLVCASFALPSGGLRALLTLFPHGGPVTNSHYAAYFLFYLSEYFVMFFFNTALVGAVMMQLDGDEPTFGDGMRIAASKLYTIFGYALIAATVGVMLRAIQERSGWIGRIVGGLLGMSWTLATTLVVPVLAANDVGPIEAIRRAPGCSRAPGAKTRSANRHGRGVRVCLPAGTRAARAHRTREKRISQRLRCSRGCAALLIGTLVIVAADFSRSGIYAVALYRYASDPAVPLVSIRTRSRSRFTTLIASSPLQKRMPSRR
jgi:hypothetical protein